MRTSLAAPALLALCWTLAVPAFAQDAPRYDPILEKRADLRLQYLRSQRAAGKPATEKATGAEARMHRSQAGFRAQGNPYLADFLALSGKRADLRIAIAREGLDAAFAHWLRRERPGALREEDTHR